ncbi:hypothetical protein BJY52DRAFT_1227886 [Lactarius psammicola]|nr:hypothetical protein BJY52DRAFT_1227886 [Lactarius psammicola]
MKEIARGARAVLTSSGEETKSSGVTSSDCCSDNERAKTGVLGETSSGGGRRLASEVWGMTSLSDEGDDSVKLGRTTSTVDEGVEADSNSQGLRFSDKNDDRSGSRATGKVLGIKTSSEGETSGVDSEGDDSGKWSRIGDSIRGGRSSFEGIRNVDADSDSG